MRRDRRADYIVATPPNHFGGISEPVVTTVLGKVNYSEQVIELDRRQPEFAETFTNYLNKRVSQNRIDKGRELLEKHRSLLLRLQQTYGVQAQYLLSFWGLETNYGSYTGKLPVLDSLATLACDPRRSNYFTTALSHNSSPRVNRNHTLHSGSTNGSFCSQTWNCLSLHV